MLAILQSEGWQAEVPLTFYLEPLKMAIWDVREILLKMFAEGPLHCKYFIEENDELHQKAIAMVKKDNIA